MAYKQFIIQHKVVAENRLKLPNEVNKTMAVLMEECNKHNAKLTVTPGVERYTGLGFWWEQTLTFTFEGDDEDPKFKELYGRYTEAVSNGGGGCYVATAVYGSYDCPQVWTLRRYRDYTLAETWYGRAFVRTYYAISPTLVKWFGHTEWFKKMWKGKLDRMVANLNANGVEDTPYEDRNW